MIPKKAVWPNLHPDAETHPVDQPFLSMLTHKHVVQSAWIFFFFLPALTDAKSSAESGRQKQDSECVPLGQAEFSQLSEGLLTNVSA